MKTQIAILLVSVLASACAGAPKLNIESDVPARIEYAGRPVCDSTPCTIKGEHWKTPFGVCKYGGASRLEAFPLDHTKGYSQKKLVEAECGDDLRIRFDLKSRPN